MTRFGLRSKEKQLIPLKKIDNKVTVKGLHAEVCSQLYYKNEDSKSMEATFTFPLDDDSAVYSFKALVDDVETVAEIQEKETAKETYDAAVAAGETAFLAEESETSGDIFRCRIGNIPPGSAATLTLAYVVDLPVDEEGAVTFTLPTVLNPRYCPPDFTGPNPSVESPVVVMETKQDTPYEFGFRLVVDNVFPVKSVSAFGDEVEIGTTDCNDPQGSPRKTVTISGNAFDHDLRVRVAYDRGMAPVAMFQAGRADKPGFLKNHVAALNFFPDLASLKEARLKEAEFVFIIDRSGSMQGDRITAAKEALLLLLKSLPVGCSFNVVSFGSSFEMLFSGGSKEYSEKSLGEALRLQKGMEANMGGTEILKPLQEVFKSKPKTSRQIFLLTDGGVGNTDQVIKLVASNAKTSRVFSVGIGEGASTSLIKGVARAGGGRAIFVTTSGQNRLQTQLLTLLRQATQAFVEEVTITWSRLPTGVECVTQIPETPPPVYSGERLVSYAVLTGDFPKKAAGNRSSALAVLTGKIGGETIRHELVVEFATEDDDPSMTLHRLAAKTLVKQLETKMEEELEGNYSRRYRALDDDDDDADDAESSPEAKERRERRRRQKREIVAVSTSANVVSRFTAFVGVDPSTKDRNTEEKVKVKVPRPARPEYCMPAGGMMQRSSMLSNAIQMPMPMSSMGMKKKSRSKMSAPSPVKSGGIFSGLFGGRGGGGGGGGESDRAESAKERRKEREMVSDICLSGFDCCEVEGSSAAAASPIGDALLRLIDLQRFGGSWPASSSLYEAVGAGDAARAFCGTGSDAERRATALAIAWLRTKMSHRRDEWRMIEEKALEWLKGGAKGDGEVEELVEQARKELG